MLTRSYKGYNELTIGIEIPDSSDFLRFLTTESFIPIEESGISSSSGIKKFAIDKYGAIYQTFLGVPSTGDFPNSGSWGTYKDATTDQFSFFYNDGTGIQTISEFDPYQTHTFGIQQHDWTPMTSEAVIDLTGISPSQTTTLTANREISFAGSVSAGKDRVYYGAISHTGDTLSIATGNDPGGFFVDPSYSPYIVAFKILPDGTPRYAGVV